MTLEKLFQDIPSSESSRTSKIQECLFKLLLTKVVTCKSQCDGFHNLVVKTISGCPSRGQSPKKSEILKKVLPE